MKITIEVDDEEVRRVLAPLIPQAPPLQALSPTRLLKVSDVAERLGISRNKVYELLYRGAIRSLTIGRTRRVSPSALDEFITRPKENSFDVDPVFRRVPMQSANTTKSPAPPPPPAPRRRRKPAEPIDLSPRPVPASSGFAMSDSEFEEVLSSMFEKGWPEDVIADIRSDHKQGVQRVYVLAINDAANYLGLTRYGVERLVKTGRLRWFTIAPTYRDEKPSQRIPAKDVLALK